MCVAAVASKGVLYQAKAYLEGFVWWCKGIHCFFPIVELSKSVIGRTLELRFSEARILPVIELSRSFSERTDEARKPVVATSMLPTVESLKWSIGSRNQRALNGRIVIPSDFLPVELSMSVSERVWGRLRIDDFHYLCISASKQHLIEYLSCHFGKQYEDGCRAELKAEVNIAILTANKVAQQSKAVNPLK